MAARFTDGAGLKVLADKFRSWISGHNADTSAHQDIRDEIQNVELGSQGEPGSDGPAFFTLSAAASTAPVGARVNDIVLNSGTAVYAIGGASMGVGDIGRITSLSPFTVAKTGNIRGAEGAKGDAGASYDWLTGAGVPANTLGKQGDMYLNKSNGDVYKKTGASAWTLQNNITGPAGSSGGSYGVCSTAAATAAKSVTVDSFVLATGARVVVRFTNANTAASPTLNVNSTGAKQMYCMGARITSATPFLRAGQMYEFVYTGTYYELIADGRESGIPLGGAFGQFLTKKSTADYDAEWRGVQLTFYVSPSGNDSTGDGTSAKPWQTVYGAINRVYGLSSPNRRITIQLAPGSYYLCGTNTMENGSNISIEGDTSNPSLYVIHSNGFVNASLFSVRFGSFLNLRGVTLQNNSAHTTYTALVMASVGGCVVLRSCLIEGNSKWTIGAGAYENGEIHVRASGFKGNLFKCLCETRGSYANLLSSRVDNDLTVDGEALLAYSNGNIQIGGSAGSEIGLSGSKVTGKRYAVNDYSRLGYTANITNTFTISGTTANGGVAY